MRRRMLGLMASAVTALAGMSAWAEAQPAPKDDLAATLAKYEAALKRGTDWFLKNQKDDGTFGAPAPVGRTALAVSAMLGTPDAKTLRNNPAIKKAIEYIVSMKQADGSLNTAGEKGLANYQTSAALTALASFGDPAQADIRKAAAAFLLSIQNTEGTDQGSFGYNKDKRGDLSNTAFALDALKNAGLDENSDAFKNCLKFLQRCQNRSESNDQPWATDDGGGIYYPGRSNAGMIKLPNGKVVFKSYGSMTYALLRDYILCGLKADDPRVQAAQKWITANYTVEANPGMEDSQQGIYYYYMAMGKALPLLGSPTLKLPDGTERNWARDLGDKLLALQGEDGAWINNAMRWEENDKVIATSFAMAALNQCYNTLARQAAAR